MKKNVKQWINVIILTFAMMLSIRITSNAAVDYSIVDNNINMLVSYIQNNGITNSSGNKVISTKMHYDSRTDLQYGIVYSSSERTLEFLAFIDGVSDSSSVDMILYVPRRATAPVSSITVASKFAFEGHTTIDIASYNSNKKYTFYTESGVALSSIDQELTNINLSMAMICWNSMTKGAIGVELAGLGFTATCKSHEFITSTTANATCTANGSTKTMCKLCGTYSTSIIPATGHTYTDWTISSGYTQRRCTTCNTIETLPATIRLSTNNKTLKVGKKFKLIISDLIYGDFVSSVKSSNKKIAKVKKKDANTYTITAVKKGTAKIKVTLASGKKATCKIKVK